MSFFLNLAQSLIKPFLKWRHKERFKGVLYDKYANVLIVSNSYSLLKIQLQEFEGLSESVVLPLGIFPKRKGYCTIVSNADGESFEVKESRMNESGKPHDGTTRFVEKIGHDYPDWRQAIERQKSMIAGGELDCIDKIGFNVELLAAVAAIAPSNHHLKIEFHGEEKGIFFSFVDDLDKNITSNLSGVIMPLRKECYE